MNVDQVHVHNVFLFRECLIVTLEVSRYDLGALQVERLQCFIHDLASEDTTSTIRIPDYIQADLLQCMDYFKKSRTWRWIRADFRHIIFHLERCLKH